MRLLLPIIALAGIAPAGKAPGGAAAVAVSGANLEAALLVDQARALLAEGHPAKAAALLRRARATDTLQRQVDVLVDRCRAAMGQWVTEDGGSGWIPGDDRLERAVRERPDSTYRAALDLAAGESIAQAVQVASALSRSHAAQAAHLKLYQDLRSRQDAVVSFHADLARKAQSRGDLADAVARWRLAWSARPDDQALLDLLQRATELRDRAIRDLRQSLKGALVSKDEQGAYDLSSKARVLFPGVEPFQRIWDSLHSLRETARTQRIDRIYLQADQGQDNEAMEAMEALVESDPQDPSLELAQSILQTRIGKRRKKQLALDQARLCESALVLGDLPRAQETFAELRRLAPESSEADRLGPRVDSLRGLRRGADAYEEALAQARGALRGGDLVAARVHLLRASSLQPSSSVVKGLLASLSGAKPPPAVARAAPSPTIGVSSADAEKAKELLLAGVASYRAGEYDRAIQSWKRVLELDSGCVQAKKYLANVGLKQTRLR